MERPCRQGRAPVSYAPLFIDEESITAGKHLEAAREGIQDYEYFVMLDRAIQDASTQGITGPELEQARRLLESLPASVCEAAGHRDGLAEVYESMGFKRQDISLSKIVA